MALNQDVDQLSKSNPVVRVDQNSESDLQALFDTVLKPDSKRPLQVPLRMRNLPDSFFNPPSTGSKSPSISHSRENSADSAFGVAVTPNGAGAPNGGANGNGNNTGGGGGSGPDLLPQVSADSPRPAASGRVCHHCHRVVTPPCYYMIQDGATPLGWQQVVLVRDAMYTEQVESFVLLRLRLGKFPVGCALPRSIRRRLFCDTSPPIMIPFVEPKSHVSQSRNRLVAPPACSSSLCLAFLAAPSPRPPPFLITLGSEGGPGESATGKKDASSVSPLKPPLRCCQRPLPSEPSRDVTALGHAAYTAKRECAN
ncbi:hypothetical protein DBV15_02283 [Temnothorax longispinosus]|uniref:Uncharacterized protein n=1 Tax=Temnothorax longispinosus TaxID=300112 RepID=A0A4S2L457_9HYME|nr:hypothetical protein DBV15_02283 [Temnothorax longispinosus]